ncbi:MAG: 50S ribosomal protein L11 methyltransferase [bacterium]
MKKILKLKLLIPINLFSKNLISNLILEGFKDIKIQEILNEYVNLNLVFLFELKFQENQDTKIQNIFSKIEKLKNNLIIFYKYNLNEVNKIIIKDYEIFDYEDYIKNYVKPFIVNDFVFLQYGNELNKLNKLEKYDNLKKIYLYPKYFAFGNDQHPTTLMVIEILSNIKKYFDKEIDLIVDYGAGNGILSLVSYYLNPKIILAIEAMFSYCFEIKYNFEINKISNGIIINSITPKILKNKISYYKNNILLANIPFSAFIDLFQDLFDLNFDLFILSGIREIDLPKFQDFIQKYNLIIIEKIISDSWGSFVCKKNF